MDIIVVSGGFDPVHSGHIDYLKSAKKSGDKLIVALNSDDWLIKKKVNLFYHLLKEKQLLNLLNMLMKLYLFKMIE